MAFKLFFISIGIAALLYFLFYIIAPLISLFIFMGSHYEQCVYENGTYGVKIKRSDPVFFYYCVNVKEMKLYDVLWEIFDVHRAAYKIFKQKRDQYGTDNKTN